MKVGSLASAGSGRGEMTKVERKLRASSSFLDLAVQKGGEDEEDDKTARLPTCHDVTKKERVESIFRVFLPLQEQAPPPEKQEGQKKKKGDGQEKGSDEGYEEGEEDSFVQLGRKKASFLEESDTEEGGDDDEEEGDSSKGDAKQPYVWVPEQRCLLSFWFSEDGGVGLRAEIVREKGTVHEAAAERQGYSTFPDTVEETNASSFLAVASHVDPPILESPSASVPNRFTSRRSVAVFPDGSSSAEEPTDEEFGEAGALLQMHRKRVGDDDKKDDKKKPPKDEKGSCSGLCDGDEVAEVKGKKADKDDAEEAKEDDDKADDEEVSELPDGRKIIHPWGECAKWEKGKRAGCCMSTELPDAAVESETLIAKLSSELKCSMPKKKKGDDA
ncbi:unnamed protein product [Amoebophrya sp. A25]|nr:unnamed protein product [Amoebophrya sp. A25]|eukprot:GSA25T00023753001.1